MNVRLLPSRDDLESKTFTVAICMNDPAKYSETFVRRHVEKLCDGRTVVVARSLRASYPDRPTSLLPTDNLRELSRRWWRAPFMRPAVKGARDADQLISFFRTHNVAFVLAEFGPLGVASYKSAKAAGLPMFCYFRGYDASRLLRNPQYVADVQAMCKSIDGIVTVSESLLGNLAAAGISCRQEFVIPSGADTAEFRPEKKRPGSCLAVGRFVEKKAPQTTVAAFARALACNRKLSLDMAGDGPELEACKKLSVRLGVRDRIRFHGAIGHAEVRRLMTTSRYFLQHSVTTQDGDAEGMPSAIQEAMSCGCAVVTTRHSGIPEHVQHDVTGILVDEHDEAQFAAELVRLSEDAVLSTTIGDNARAYAVRHLDCRMLQGRLETLIETEVARNRA